MEGAAGLGGGARLRPAASAASGKLDNSAVTGVRAGEPEAARTSVARRPILDIGAAVARRWRPPLKPD